MLLNYRYTTWFIFFLSKKTNAFTTEEKTWIQRGLTNPFRLAFSKVTSLLISGEPNPPLNLTTIFSTVLRELFPLDIGVLSDVSYWTEGILPYSFYRGNLNCLLLAFSKQFIDRVKKSWLYLKLSLLKKKAPDLFAAWPPFVKPVSQ